MNVPISGHIELILGPMFSGKSTELMRRIRRYKCANQRCLVVKYDQDMRYTSQAAVATHDRQMIPALPCIALAALTELEQYDVIGIDEGQFYDDIAEWAEQQANAGRIVIIAALDGTYQRKPFGHILNVVPLAEDVIKLTAVCVGCHQHASFSYKHFVMKKRTGGVSEQGDIFDNDASAETVSSEISTVVDIGGADKYVAMCRACYMYHTQHPMQRVFAETVEMQYRQVNSDNEEDGDDSDGLHQLSPIISRMYGSPRKPLSPVLTKMPFV